MRAAHNFELAAQAHREGRSEQAEESCRELLQENPLEPKALYLLAVLAIGRGDDAAAHDLLARAVGNAADSAAFLAAFHGNLLISLRSSGRLEQGSNALVQAITSHQDLADATHELGLALLEQGEPDAAIQCFERVAELRPEMFANQRQLARALAVRGAVKRAVGHYHCALVLEPTSIEVMLELAEALAKLGRKPAASALVVRARALNGGA